MPKVMFQHTAARRRLRLSAVVTQAIKWVSTHSRPKAAAGGGYGYDYDVIVSTHSRPKAAAI